MISTVVPLLIPADWLAAHRLVDGARLGVAGGAIVGFVVLEGASYAWHRAEHTFSVLWRGVHQMHHSPRRVDIPGSPLFHPLEVTVQTLIQLTITVVVLGLDPLGAAIVGYTFEFKGCSSTGTCARRSGWGT